MNRQDEGRAHEDHAARAAREAEEAQARLDQMRNETGSALSGREIKDRLGLGGQPGRAEADQDAPPLDWRMTPRNIAIQLVVVVIFIAVIWFMIDLVISGVETLLS